MKVLLLYVLLCVQFFSCAQVHSISKKMIATYTVHNPGNIAVDDSGNELNGKNIIPVVYLETTSKDLHLEKALLDKSEYVVTQQLVSSQPYLAGINFKTNEKVMAQPDKNNFLWRIEIAPISLKTNSEYQIDTIILKGKYQGKVFEQKITDWIELSELPTY